MKKSLFYLTAAVILTATFAACTADIVTLPTGVMLDQSALTITPGESLTLAADVFPDEASIKTLSWSSSNPDVATVTDGVVTGISEGTAAITVTTHSGQKTQTCVVTVAWIVSNVQLDKGSALLLIGNTLRLTPTVLPDDAPDKSVTWESSHPHIASVNDGVVTALSEGTATISVITDVGKRVAQTAIKVPAANANIVTMTLSGSQPFVQFISVTLAGSGGYVDIDWGDYNFETNTLWLTTITPFTHSYYINPAVSRTITIAAPTITRMEITKMPIQNLDISKCSALTSLVCSNNQLASLDVSANTALADLNCSGNQITSLVLGNNTALRRLDCRWNQLTSLDVSNKTALTELLCNDNSLTSLVVNNNSVLTTLNCSNNELSVQALDDLFDMLPIVSEGLLTFDNNPGASGCNKRIAENKGWFFLKQMFLTLENSGMVYIQMTGSGRVEIDWGDGSPVTSEEMSYSIREFSHLYSNITSCTITIQSINITQLNCYNCRVTSLDVSNNYSLTNLSCSQNRLTNLDVSNNDKLTYLECNYNQLSSLDVSNNTALTYLKCIYNQLTSLDVSNNTALIYLECNDNQLTSLDVNSNILVDYLICDNNQLSSLDVSNNAGLAHLSCSGNQLTSLDMSYNTLLSSIYCHSNQLSTEALNALFETLHDNDNRYKWIGILYNPGTDTCDQSIATNKGWIFY